MVQLDIEYCAPCRIAGEAVTTRRVLADRLRKYDEIDAVSLVPSAERTFRVRVDGETVWSVDPDDDLDPMEAVAAVRARLAS